MKFATFTLLAVALLPLFGSGFMIGQPQQQRSMLLAAGANAAKSAEEDLELTRKVIQDFVSATTGEAPAPAPAAAPESEKKDE